jgi:hypothetical protein
MDWETLWQPPCKRNGAECGRRRSLHPNPKRKNKWTHKGERKKKENKKIPVKNSIVDNK